MEHWRVAVVECWLGQVSGGNHVHQHLAFQCLTLAQETKGRPQDAVPVEEAKTTGCGSLRVSSRSHGHWSLGSPSVGGGGGLSAHWHLPSHYALQKYCSKINKLSITFSKCSPVSLYLNRSFFLRTQFSPQTPAMKTALLPHSKDIRVRK